MNIDIPITITLGSAYEFLAIMCSIGIGTVIISAVVLHITSNPTRTTNQVNTMKIHITEVTTYRSEGTEVNMTDGKARVVLDMTRNDWRRLKRQFGVEGVELTYSDYERAEG